MSPRLLALVLGLLVAAGSWKAHAAAPLLFLAVAAVAAAAGSQHLRRARHRREHPQAAAYLLLGPEGSTAPEERAARLARAFPEVSSETRARWLAAFEQLDQLVWIFARSGARAKILESLFERTATRRFPFLDERARAAAWSLACRLAIEQGYAKDPEPLPPALFEMAASPTSDVREAAPLLGPQGGLVAGTFRPRGPVAS